jgi:NOL1/NOP2/sun family putative RNA methylase
LASIGDVKKKLPGKFIDNVYKNFPPGIADKVLSGIASERFTTLRANSIKTDIHYVMDNLKENNIKFERVPWYKDALIIKNAKEKDIEKLELYNKGFIYVQNLSSMVPPLILKPSPDEKILDIASSPGSKTTEMAALMNNKGYIMANEIDKIRIEKLKYNIEMQGASIVEVKLGRGEKIGDVYPEFFDRAMVDVPCSGEGRFLLNDARTYRHYNPESIRKLVPVQKKLLASAVKAVKSGGVIVYSTCTLNQEENEEVIEFALNNLNIAIADIDIEISGSVENSYGSSEIVKSIRIIPSKYMEGFFVCKMIKK